MKLIYRINFPKKKDEKTFNEERACDAGYLSSFGRVDIFLLS
jgi:hypothetical protein